MKTPNILLLLGLTVSFTILSCERVDRLGFSIEFSDDIVINEKDITFYDSSTCILFLKEKIILPAVTDNSLKTKYPEFSVFINEDNIYEGIIYPMASMISPSPIFILEQIEPTDVVPFSFVGFFPEATDARNDKQIIDYLDSKNLLHHGLSCTLDSVNIHSYIDSSVTCSFTIKNNDNVNYYIPDPEKLGTERFEYYAGGLILRNKETDGYLQPKTENSTAEWNSITMEHLSLLQSTGAITYTYTTILDSPILKGNYKCDFDFGRKDPYGLAIPENLTLDQKEGRIWVGGARTSLDNILFE